MSGYAMICGELVHPAERRTAKSSGNEFVSALMKVNKDGLTEWWRVMVFERAMCDELMSLNTGDVLTCKGRCKLDTYLDRDGVTKISPVLFAGQISTMRAPAKKTKADKPQVKPGDPQPYNDEICF
jgi:hypothetical protein